MVTRGGDIKHCIEHFMHDKTETGAAKLFVCLQDNREAMVCDDDLKQLPKHGRRMGRHLGTADGGNDQTPQDHGPGLVRAR